MAIFVNGVEIPEAAIQFELDRLVKFYSQHMSPQQIREQMEALKTKAREQAVGAQLLIAEAARLNLIVPESEIQARFANLVKSVGGEERLDQLLRKQNLDRATMLKSIEQGRRVDLLVDKITAGISDPTEEDILAHFRAHRSEYAKPDRAEAQHILIKPHSNRQEDRNVARSKLSEIRHRIQDGAAFADQAAAHSECPSGKRTGGSLGWVSRGMMIPELDDAVFSLEVGALSEIIESPLGFHIIRKSAHENGGEAAFVDVREKIRDFLRHVARGNAIGVYVEDLRKKAVIEEN